VKRILGEATSMAILSQSFLLPSGDHKLKHTSQTGLRLGAESVATFVFSAAGTRICIAEGKIARNSKLKDFILRTQ